MPIASIARIPMPVAARAGAPGLAMPAIKYVAQSENNWCWAACAEMLYQALQGLAKSQCTLASSLFGRACCPSPGAPSGCDQGAWPNQVYPPGLPTNLVPNPLSLGGIRSELAAGKPVQVCYQWRNGGRHVALIVGEHPNGDFEVFDPWRGYGPGPRALSQINSAYALGRWECSFTF